MRTIIIVTVLLLSACATTPRPFTLLPWQCASTVEPIDAEVIKQVGDYYIYDCLWNGNGNEGNGSDGEGAE